jgi:predicted CDP-diglyceride synthetase/phosphatidate cytidylyltransferase
VLDRLDSLMFAAPVVYAIAVVDFAILFASGLVRD